MFSFLGRGICMPTSTYVWLPPLTLDSLRLHRLRNCRLWLVPLHPRNHCWHHRSGIHRFGVHSIDRASSEHAVSRTAGLYAALALTHSSDADAGWGAEQV